MPKSNFWFSFTNTFKIGKRQTCHSNLLQERLLKPLSGFSGISGEMRELAAIISRVTHKQQHTHTHTINKNKPSSCLSSLWSTKCPLEGSEELRSLNEDAASFCFLMFHSKGCLHKANSSSCVPHSACLCVPPLKDIHLHSPNVRWEDIIGLEDAKRLVKEAVVYPIKVRPLPGHAGISAPLDSEYVSFKGLKEEGGRRRRSRRKSRSGRSVRLTWNLYLG